KEPASIREPRSVDARSGPFHVVAKWLCERLSPAPGATSAATSRFRSSDAMNVTVAPSAAELGGTTKSDLLAPQKSRESRDRLRKTSFPTCGFHGNEGEMTELLSSERLSARCAIGMRTW